MEKLETGRSTSKDRGRDVHDTHTIPLQRTHKPGHRGAELEAGRWDGLRPAACAALGGGTETAV